MIRVMYLKDNKGDRIGCVAIDITTDKSFAKYQLSVVNPIDKFDKSVARQLAKGRLLEAPHTVFLPKNPSMHDITKEVFADICLDKLAPARARKAAKAWLRYNGDIRIHS